MSGYIRQIQSSDGTPITAPSTVILGAASYVVFANDAAYEAVYGAGSEGDAYFNSTDQQVRVYKNAAWEYHKADESVYDNATSGLTATDVQAAIDEVEGRVDAVESGKQDDVITTRGDTIIGNASGDASRLAIGSAGFVLTSDGTDPAWAPAAGGGGVGGKNYILNPDAAVNETTGVTNTATTGSWTINRTTTAAELPEETKGTAYKISGSTLTVGDTVEFAIEATGIDDADGGYMGRAVCKVLDVSGSINGQYEIQVYNVTDSAYVGDSDTITGTGTYILSVPFVAGNDYEFHLRAATGSTAWTNIGISGVTIEPVSQTTGTIITKWQDVGAVSNIFTGSTGTATVDHKNWRQVGQNLEYDIVLTFDGTGSGNGTFQLHDTSLTPVLGNNKFIQIGTLADESGNEFRVYGLYNSSTKTFTTYRGHTDTTATSGLLTYSSYTSTRDLHINFSLQIEEWANSHTPTISDVQYANARGRWYRNAAYSYTASTDFAFDTEDTTTFDAPVGISNSSGVFTVTAAGTYDITCGLGTNPQWAANNIMSLYVNRSGGGLTQERILDRIGGSSSYTMSGNAAVKLGAGDSISIRCNNSATISPGSVSSWIEIERRSDFSARSASLPLSDNADTTQQYLLPDIRTSGEGDLGTITNWATVDSKKYRWYVIGKICYYEHRCESTTASSSNVLLQVIIPSDVPTPKNFSGQGSPSWLGTCNSSRSTGITTVPSAGDGHIYKQSASDYRISGYTDTASASKFWAVSAFWQID